MTPTTTAAPDRDSSTLALLLTFGTPQPYATLTFEHYTCPNRRSHRLFAHIYVTRPHGQSA